MYLNIVWIYSLFPKLSIEDNKSCFRPTCFSQNWNQLSFWLSCKRKKSKEKEVLGWTHVIFRKQQGRVSRATSLRKTGFVDSSLLMPGIMWRSFSQNRQNKQQPHRPLFIVWRRRWLANTCDSLVHVYLKNSSSIYIVWKESDTGSMMFLQVFVFAWQGRVTSVMFQFITFVIRRMRDNDS